MKTPDFSRPMKALARLVSLWLFALPLADGRAEAEPLVIAAWGDSLTFGKGATSRGQSYPEQACAMIGDCIVHNMGWGGQSSTQIAVRQGALPLTVRLRDGALPADPAPAALAAPSVDVLTIGGAPAGSLPGTLAGVPGTLETDPAGRWAFLRSQSGAALQTDAALIFQPRDGAGLRQAETWIWAGRNNLRAKATVLRDIAAMVASLGHDRYLVGEILPSAKDRPDQTRALAALNAELALQYGPHFVPLISALQAAGDGSARDQAAIRDGMVPASLRSDRVHLNDRGYGIVAAQFVARWRARQG